MAEDDHGAERQDIVSANEVVVYGGQCTRKGARAIEFSGRVSFVQGVDKEGA